MTQTTAHPLTVAKVAGVEPVAGGVRNFMLRTAEELERRGHDVDCVFADALLPRVRHAGARRLLVPWAVVAHVVRAQRRGRRYDVVEVHEPIAAAYCLLRRRLPRLALPPCVVISYGAEECRWRAQRERWQARGERPSRKSLVTVPLSLLPQSRYAFRHADHVLVGSASDADYVAGELGVPRSRIGRADSAIDPAYLELPHRPGGGAPRLLFIGSWIDRKGTPELVAAWARVARRHGDARLTVACTVDGEEVIRPQLEFGERVAVQPRCTEEELRDLLSRHDIYVLPAWYEGGAALASLQAAAAGLACVATDIGGTVDVFRQPRPEEDGAVLVATHSAEAIADGVDRVISEPGLAGALGQRGRVRARAFTWARTVDESVTGYRAAIAAGRRRS